MAANADVCDRLLNRRHMARDTPATLAVSRVLRVKRERPPWPRLKHRAMTLGAYRIARESQQGFMPGPVAIMTGITAHALAIHLPLHVIVPLHSILVGGAVGPMG